MVWKIEAYHDKQIHVLAPVSVIETGVPSYHKPVVRFENDFVGVENFVRSLLLFGHERKISKEESEEACSQIFKYLKVRSWKGLAEQYSNYSIVPRSRGVYVISRARFYNEKYKKGFGHDDSFLDQEINLREPGSISRRLVEMFTN